MIKQELLEFLLTYGWAILIVLAAMVALAYFGYQPITTKTIYNVSDVCEISGETTITKQMIDKCCVIDNVTAQCRFKSPTYMVGV